MLTVCFRIGQDTRSTCSQKVATHVRPRVLCILKSEDE